MQLSQPDRHLGRLCLWVAEGDKKNKIIFLLIFLVRSPLIVIAIMILIYIFDYILFYTGYIVPFEAFLDRIPRIQGPTVVIYILLGLGILLVYRSLYARSRDRAALKRAQKFTGTRAEIASSFLSFRRRAYRLKYARWLDARSTDSYVGELLKSPDNRWPEGWRPNIDNDTASILLARLDERWLGLDR
jgi:hypothetical protein